MNKLIQSLKTIIDDKENPIDWEALLLVNSKENFPFNHNIALLEQYIKNEDGHNNVKWAVSFAVEKGTSLFVALKFSFLSASQNPQSWLGNQLDRFHSNILDKSVLENLELMKHIIKKFDWESEENKKAVMDIWVMSENTTETFIPFAIFGLEARNFFLQPFYQFLESFLYLNSVFELKRKAINQSVKDGLTAVKDTVVYLLGEDSFYYTKSSHYQETGEYPDNWTDFDGYVLFPRLEKVYTGQLSLDNIKTEHNNIRQSYFNNASNYFLESLLAHLDGCQVNFDYLKPLYNNTDENTFLLTITQIDPKIITDPDFWAHETVQKMLNSDDFQTSDLIKEAKEYKKNKISLKPNWESLLS